MLEMHTLEKYLLRVWSKELRLINLEVKEFYENNTLGTWEPL